MIGAIPSRDLLLDRYQGVMDWHRTGGNASEQYVALIGVLGPLVERVAGDPFPDPADNPEGQAVDELVERLGDLVVDVIQHRHYLAARGTFTGTADELADLERSGLGTVPDPVLVEIDPKAERVDCRAAVFDVHDDQRQCTRPAKFTRNGLLVCKLHAKPTVRVRSVGR